jgi:hypothetical protein
MSPGLVQHLRELQHVVRLRHAALQKASDGKEDAELDKQRSQLALDRDVIVKRLEERLLYEEIGQ